MAVTMALLRCARCGSTLYGPPNSIEAGDRCDAPMIAEFFPGVLVYKECFGRFEAVGRITVPKRGAPPKLTTFQRAHPRLDSTNATRLVIT